MKIPLFALLLLAPPVLAAETAADSIPPAFRSCAAIKRNAERLGCYDRAVAALMAGKDATAMPATPESSFGLLAGAGAAPLEPAKEQQDDLQSMNANVKGFGRAADGSLIIHFDNGQSWRQLSGGDPLLKAGDTVTISRGALGSFQMRAPSGRMAKVRRITLAAP